MDNISCFNCNDSQMKAFYGLRQQLYAIFSNEQIESDSICLLVYRDNIPVARLAIQTAQNLVGAPGLSGLISHYEAIDAVSGVELLTYAVKKLKLKGVRRILGPMDGNSWGNYRIALPSIERDPSFDPPHFFTEPQNPLEYVSQFIAAGFLPIATYESRVFQNLEKRNQRALKAQERFIRQGIRFRPIQLEYFEKELEQLFAVCCEAFKNNVYYQPLSTEKFKELYFPLLSLLRPQFVRLAVLPSEKPVGFVLAFPDLFNRKRLILKTLARISGTQYGGIGLVLAEQIHQAAHQMGFEMVIHALMHEKNISMKLSHGYESLLFRRYALMGMSCQNSESV